MPPPSWTIKSGLLRHLRSSPALVLVLILCLVVYVYVWRRVYKAPASHTVKAPATGEKVRDISACSHARICTGKSTIIFYSITRKPFVSSCSNGSKLPFAHNTFLDYLFLTFWFRVLTIELNAKDLIKCKRSGIQNPSSTYFSSISHLWNQSSDNSLLVITELILLKLKSCNKSRFVQQFFKSITFILFSVNFLFRIHFSVTITG